MFKNYLKTAWRNLIRSKSFTIINIAGLAIGLACFMLIAVFAYNEFNYDKYSANAKDIYRVNLSVTGNGDVAVYPMVDVAVAEGIKNAYPEVKAAARLSQAGTNFIKFSDKQFKEEHLAYVDSNFLQLFSIPLIEGNSAEALKQPNSIVVSKSFSKKYFGNKEAIGKSLIIGKDAVFKVTGIIDKVPDNSHFHFDAFLSLSTFHIKNETWSNVGFYTYLLLNKNADPKKLEAKFPQLVAKYVVPETQRDMGISLAEAMRSVNTFVFSLQPLADIHLHSGTKYEIEANGDIKYVYIFSALAIFILLLACVNFTNLSTARAAKRAREVGIRKVMGSLKKQLIFQFLTESLLVTFCAMLFAYLLILLVLPYFNLLSGKHFSFISFISHQFVFVMFLLSVLTGLLAGFYPAFLLSAFNTIRVLKGSLSAQGSPKNTLRSGLVVFQFFVSTALIIATIIVYRQLHFMQNKKLGYDKEQVLYLPYAGLLGKNQLAFEQQLLQDKRVVSASIGSSVPGNPNMDGTEIYANNQSSNGTQIHTNIYYIDYDYLPTLGIHILQGRNFSKDFSSDSAGVLINEAAVHQLGWSRTNPVGKSIVRSGQQEFKVVGVVADFHYASVKQKIAPLIMMLRNNNGGLMIKIHTDDVKRFVTDLKKRWNAFNAAGPFDYHFLDDNYASLYAAEQTTGRIFTAFTIVAILIASLGLFGLAAFITEQRTKEIGIRKVLGASVNQVLLLVSKEFLMLVGIAFIISIPVTWWAMHAWLQDFAYRADISIWMFAAAGMAVTLLALITVSFQAIKAAVANPVKSLRTE